MAEDEVKTTEITDAAVSEEASGMIETIDKNGNRVVALEGVGSFVFGRPKLKRRHLIGQVMSTIQKSSDGKKVIKGIAKRRGISFKQASELKESEYTEDELEMLQEGLGIDTISSVLTEAIYAAVIEYPWDIKTMDDLEDHLDYADAVKLVKPAMEVIKDAILSTIERKN